ncbi:MAG: acyl-CoA thioesterase [Acidimicrobiales bacterium]
MDARTFLGLVPRDESGLHHRLEVTSAVATGSAFLFGGCGLAAAIEAMEIASSRPCVWATAQYLSFATVGSTLDLDVTLAVTGHHTTQARCVGHVGDQEILTVNAALGHRDGAEVGLWAERPDVPPPDRCESRTHFREMTDTIMDRVDVRIAAGRQFTDLDGTYGSGRSALWARIPELLEPSAAALAVLGDFVPSGVAQALGARAGGRSLDNTLRVVEVIPTEWVLVDLRIHAIQRGFGHGLAHLWAEDGALLATASQSVVVRYWDGR